MKVTFEKKKILKENAVTGQGLPTYGTQVLMNVINEIGACRRATTRMCSSKARARFRPKRCTSHARPTARRS
jgi:hypothetical protein